MHPVARELGIDTVFAQVLPADKAERIRQLQSQGKRVAMVGDGVNDAPALLTADVGIALVRSDPRDVPRIVKLSRATYRKMVWSLWWAAATGDQRAAQRQTRSPRTNCTSLVSSPAMRVSSAVRPKLRSQTTPTYGANSRRTS